MAITSNSYVVPNSSSRTGDDNRLKPSLFGDFGRVEGTGAEAPFASGTPTICAGTSTGAEMLDR